MSTRHLVVMAAGTGGHVIPGLAVAAEMQRRGWTVSWLGTEAGMENKLVPPSGLPMDRLSFAGLRGKGLKHSLLGVVRLFKALGQSAHVFSARKADAVLGMGGYVCFPGGLMAWVMRRPLMLVNADAARNKRAVFDDHVPGQKHVVRQHDMAPHHAIVRDVRSGHQQVMLADHRGRIELHRGHALHPSWRLESRDCRGGARAGRGLRERRTGSLLSRIAGSARSSG